MSSIDALLARLQALMARRRVKAADAAEPFGARLARLRKARGLTQVELAERLGVSQPVLSYYEKQSRRVPPALLVRLAEILDVPLDELLGRTSTPAAPVTGRGRLWRHLREIQQLPVADRKAILRVIDGMLARYRLAQQRG